MLPGLAPHPIISHMYATACADGYVAIWDAKQRINVKMIKIERGSTTKLQKRQGYIGWDNDEEDIFVKSHSDGGKEKDHLQAWSVCFSDDGTMMAVSTNGVVDDINREHADLGGSLIIYECDPKM